MSEISTLAILQQLDRQRLKENPYSPHSLADEDENTRRQYCALLFMVLLNQGPIGEDQLRMLQLWLPTINMEGRQAELCQMAVKLSQEGLAEAIDTVRDAGGNHCFMLDCLVFSRVNAPLTQSQVTLFEALAQMLNIGEVQMDTIVYLTCLIIGLPVENRKPRHLALGLHALSVWHEFLTSYIDQLFSELKEWARENDVSQISLRKNISDLAGITTLDLYPSSWKNIAPFPAGLSLLVNLDWLGFDSFKITEFPDSNVLPQTLGGINIGGYGQISRLPDSICHLKKLKKLSMPGSNLKSVSEKVYLFLKNNAIEHSISDSCFIKGPQ
ncbi:hypothetical protein [Lelliottia sp. RWM.1]|uniref:hypothetical protein n=1 Tax=Lelliottia sp. RWM.1 TaxID=2663242 RepID=UPI00193D2F4D|nr:hypothetical protein [Lelliottia sp. RWM.1]MBM3073716.1 hypothetical protein [Lelliottia sp. RWM.1]